MAQLVVRKIEEDVKERLRRRAAKHGRSLEAEVRQILRDAAGPRSPAADEIEKIGLGTWIAKQFKDIGFEDDIPELRGHFVEPPSFE